MIFLTKKVGRRAFPTSLETEKLHHAALSVSERVDSSPKAVVYSKCSIKESTLQAMGSFVARLPWEGFRLEHVLPAIL